MIQNYKIETTGFYNSLQSLFSEKFSFYPISRF